MFIIIIYFKVLIKRKCCSGFKVNKFTDDSGQRGSIFFEILSLLTSSIIDQIIRVTSDHNRLTKHVEQKGDVDIILVYERSELLNCILVVL